MRLFLIPLLLSSVLASGACSEAQEYEAKVGLEEGAGSTTDRPVADAANDTDAEPGAVELQNERAEFSHTWPAAANAIPKLAARFESEAQTALGEAQAMSRCGKGVGDGCRHYRLAEPFGLDLFLYRRGASQLRV